MAQHLPWLYLAIAGAMLELLGVPAAERTRRVGSLMERVGITHRAAALPGEMESPLTLL